MTKSAVPRRHLPSSPFKAPVEQPIRQFSVGDRVTHDEHGLGRVVGIEEGIAVLVDFGSVQKRVLSPYTKMAAL
ncbi:hypothetical protein J7E99_29150 [Streptomyces sp. ISL-44]|uniref:CarD family transcriptional regulator n=1 Tax=unclassified Streptomyces TaxID=2593676 RepID=UPI001BE6496E|nr:MULTISPECIES: CarD family transcriptional regulator [unclassified Streptomyces]MBT2544662.1 hypothetical protein [Streptomyces sp. ISL-44]MCX5016341.1 hypothetical protein [Streptomyces sp. NBC_00555]MCX5609031.1 hypothetical protein [Streptomyces sp. NBC_00047]UUU42977.1 hypothetical protein JIW86_31685 [Streptomyces sp. NBC_00162]